MKDSKYIYIHSPDNKNEAIIWTITHSGKYSKLNAVDMANYLVGQIKKDYTDFETEDIRISTDKSIVELAANYTKNGIKQKAVFTIVTKNNATMLSAYAASQESFSEIEPVLREILASYKMSGNAPVKTLKLVPWQDTSASRSATGMFPQGWAVYVWPDCSTWALRAYDPNNHANQIFIYQELMFYGDQQSRDRDRALKSQSIQLCPTTAATLRISTQDCINDINFRYSYTDNPVSDATPRSFIADAFPEMTHSPNVRALIPQSPIMDDVTIQYEGSAEQSVAAAYAAYGFKTANIFANFTADSGYPALGIFTVATSPILSQAGMWSGTVIAYSTEPAKFEELSPTIIPSLSSIQYTQEFVSSCNKAMELRSQAIADNYKTIQETSDIIASRYSYKKQTDDTLSEKRSDATLGVERVYDPDTGEVYAAYNGFYSDYSTHTEQFNQKNLRPLTENEWGLVPLDGNLHIN